ncbi:MAG: GDP-mannose 4,6-dehydratase [Marmoricola sp.]
MTTTHLITGVTGQDGVLLARLLRAEGGRVIGTCRPGSAAARAMAPYLEGVEIVEVDMRDRAALAGLVHDVQPTEVYNLAAMSSVGMSWQHEREALETNGAAAAALVDIAERLPHVRLLQAASVEENADASSSPYARGKAQAREAVTGARDRGSFAVSAVLHIHESPLRRPQFVVRKISRAAAEIAVGRLDRLALGRLDIVRDWGAAADHVVAMRQMLAADEPRDFEVATGILHSLRDVVDVAFQEADVNGYWDLIDQDPTLTRPADAADIRGNGDAISTALGWTPRLRFEDVVRSMVRADLARVSSGVEEDPRYLTL